MSPPDPMPRFIEPPDPIPRPSLSNRLSRWALAPVSVLYASGARMHRTIGRWMRTKRSQPACVVVSVGGLTVGGAGKTPVAAALALALHRRGRRVVLASRGYRGRSRNRVTVVSDGCRVLSDVERAGDEPLLLAAHAPGVPVLIGRDRRIVGHHAVSIFDAEILVLDDGFQHHRLARDLDIVCIDAVAGLGNHRVLPWGPLREPLSALRYADWLCVVDAGDRDKEAKLVERFAAAGRGVLRAHRRPSEIRSLDGRKRSPAISLAGRSVGILAGVARPGSFRRTLEALGARVVGERIFRDHHAYRESDCRSLESSVAEWVTTEKDALKILPDWLGATQLSVLAIEIEFEAEGAVLDEIESLTTRNPAK